MVNKVAVPLFPCSLPSSHRRIFWTSGCYRVSASEQDLNWGRDMQVLMMGLGLGGLHHMDGGSNGCKALAGFEYL